MYKFCETTDRAVNWNTAIFNYLKIFYMLDIFYYNFCDIMNFFFYFYSLILLHLISSLPSLLSPPHLTLPHTFPSPPSILIHIFKKYYFFIFYINTLLLSFNPLLTF